MVDALVEYQYSARARSAEELVRRYEQGIDRRVITLASWFGVHIDIDIGRAGGVIETGDRPMSMQQARKLVNVCANAGDVRGCGKGADAQAVLVRRVLQQLFQMCEIDMPGSIQAHFNRSYQRLPPGNFVRVMFVWPDKNDRLPGREEFAEGIGIVAGTRVVHQLIDFLASGRRQRDADNLLQLVDRAGGPGTAADNSPTWPGIHRLLDRRFRFMQQLAHAASGDVVFGVGVCVHPLQTLQVRLHEAQTPARCRVIAINHQAFAKRRLESRIHTDNLLPQICRIE